MFIPQSERDNVEAEMKKFCKVVTDRFHYHNKSVSGNDFVIEWSAHKHLDNRTMLIGLVNIDPIKQIYHDKRI